MPRFMSPGRDELGRLRTPLTAGELKVLELLDRKLDEEWEIYIQPHLNGMRPDFVVLHPLRGIGVVEVKDWDLDAMSYCNRLIDGHPVMTATSRNGKTFRLPNPVIRTAEYRGGIASLLPFTLEELVAESAGALRVVECALVMTCASTERAKELAQPYLPFGQVRYVHVCGSEALCDGKLQQLLPWAAS